MHCLGFCCWITHGCLGVYLWRTIIVDLHYRFPGSDRLRHDPPCVLYPVFSVWHYGGFHRCAAGHGCFCNADGDHGPWRMRHPTDLDLYHFPDSPFPHTPVPVFLLYGILDLDTNSTVDCVFDCVPQKSGSGGVVC